MSPEIRDALEAAAGVGGNGGPLIRPAEIVRKPVSAIIMRHRLIAFLQEVDESLSVRELLDDLREGLHLEQAP